MWIHERVTKTFHFIVLNTNFNNSKNNWLGPVSNLGAKISQNQLLGAGASPKTLALLKCTKNYVKIENILKFLHDSHTNTSKLKDLKSCKVKAYIFQRPAENFSHVPLLVFIIFMVCLIRCVARTDQLLQGCLSIHHKGRYGVQGGLNLKV